jgi:N-acetylglucosamine-6-phosphate deacetylase
MHSSFHSVNLVKKIKGDRVYIVTDAVTPMGTDIKEFRFADQLVKVVNGRCVNEQGALAGSNIDMLSSVKNAVTRAGIAEGEALRMAALYPARAMGLDLTMGALRPAMRANLIAYDRDWKLTLAMFEGEAVHLG